MPPKPTAKQKTVKKIRLTKEEEEVAEAVAMLNRGEISEQDFSMLFAARGPLGQSVFVRHRRLPHG